MSVRGFFATLLLALVSAVATAQVPDNDKIFAAINDSKSDYYYPNLMMRYQAGEPLTDEQKSHVIGIQANLWTEYIATYDHLEDMVYPRMDAVSEVQWCQPESKDWERFRRGLDRMRSVYEVMGYNYATHIWGE